MRLVCVLVVGFSLLFSVSRVALGQDVEVPVPNMIAEAPVFAFLGASPASVSRPTSARALTTDILNAIGPAGEVQQGIAVEFAPWSLIPGVRIPLTDYQSKMGSYILANTQISLATVRSAGDSASTDVGAGFRMTLFNRGDPMTSKLFTRALDLKMSQICGQPADYRWEEKDRYTHCFDSLYVSYREEWVKEHWNESALTLAGATGWRFRESETDKDNWMGLALWMTGALKLGRRGQGLFQVGYDHRKAVWPDTVLAHNVKFGVRGIAGGPDFNLYTEYVGSYNFEAGEDGYSARFSGGLEYRIAEGMWISTGVGRYLQRPEPAEQIFIIADVRWEISKGPRLR
jgi:hypothetical protein